MLGKRIKKLRKSRNISQKAFGEIFNVSQQAVWKWESDLNEPDASTLVKIADFFGVSCDFLLGRANCKNGYILEGSQLPQDLQKDGLQIEVVKEISNSGLTEKQIIHALKLYKLYAEEYNDDHKHK